MLASYSRFMVFSHGGGGTGLHKDAWNNAFWNTCVHGRKRWVLLPDLVRRVPPAAAAAVMRHATDPHRWWAEVHPTLAQLAAAHNFTWYEFMQEPGDLVFVPAGGWFHQVVSLEDSASVSFNMMVEEDIGRMAKTFCQRSATHLPSAIKACNVLSQLRPTWFTKTCCAAFLRNPEAFPMASPLEETMVYPHANVEYA